METEKSVVYPPKDIDRDWTYELQIPRQAALELELEDLLSSSPCQENYLSRPQAYEPHQNPHVFNTRNNLSPTSDNSLQGADIDETFNIVDEVERTYDELKRVRFANPAYAVYSNYDTNNFGLSNRTTRIDPAYSTNIEKLPWPLGHSDAEAYDKFNIIMSPLFIQMILDEHPLFKYDPQKKDEYAHGDGTEEMDESVGCTGIAEFLVLASICQSLPFATFTPNYLWSLEHEGLGSGPLGANITSFVSCIWRDVLQQLEFQPPDDINLPTINAITDFLSLLVIYNDVFGADENNLLAQKSRHPDPQKDFVSRPGPQFDYKKSSYKWDDLYYFDPTNIPILEDSFTLYPGRSGLTGTFRNSSYWTSNWELVLENQFELRCEWQGLDTSSTKLENFNLADYKYYTICQIERVFPESIEVEITVELEPAPAPHVSSQSELADNREPFTHTTGFYVHKGDIKPEENAFLDPINEEVEEG
ncbi:hypothetical protein AA313_de0204514 [Arthrobotrys entomopaga]|nr:hypothetical protein AA313_de0204514 [Arthrobotrys entomopaga]